MISNSKTKQIVALATMLALALIVATRLRRLDVDEPPAVAAPEITDPGLNSAVPAAAAMDSRVCAECHAEIVADYARSGMSQTWRAVAAGGTLPELQGEAQVADLVTGYRYRVSITATQLEQIETRDDDARHALHRQAKYLVGSGKHAVAAVASAHGYLTQLPVAWFRHDHAWRMNPGFELHNHRFDRPVTPGCVACHGTVAVHEPPTANRFQEPIIAGIDCQRCHGPATQHVAFWSSAADVGKAPNDSTKARDASLAKTIGMSPSLSNDLCLQCHLQGDATVYRSASDPLQLRPGDRLRDHRHDYLVDAGEQSDLGIASHGARMLRSRCYLESQGTLTCVLCHDPHKPAADQDAAFYDSKCATCHPPQSCQRESASPEAARTSGCTACHMPQRSSREGIHLVFTDHAIVRHKPSQDTFDVAPAVLVPNAAHVKLVSAWPEETPDRATLGAAYIVLHETMGPQLPALERGAEILSAVIDQNPADLDSRFWRGSALAALGRGQEAIPLLQAVVADQSERHLARFRLAIAYELVGDNAQAIRQYQQLVDRVPSWIEPYPRLAQLYIARQQPELAIGVLRQQLTYQQNALALAQLSLAERMRGGSHAVAMTQLAEALRLDPRLPTAYVHRAALWLLIGQHDAAREDFQRVLQLDPHNQQAQHALKTLNARPR